MTGLFTSDVTKNSARLNWDPYPAVQLYLIRGRALGALSWVTLSVGPNQTHKDVSGLAENTTYEWQISPVTMPDCFVNGMPGYSSSLTFYTVCHPVDSAWVELVTANGARLSWSHAQGSLGYQVRGRRIGTAGWSNAFTSGGQNTTKDVFGLIPGESYEWMVRSVCNTNTHYSSSFTMLDTFTTVKANRTRPDNQEIEITIANGLLGVTNQDGQPYIFQVVDLSGRIVLTEESLTQVSQ